MARASWIAPLIGLGLNVSLVGSGNQSVFTSLLISIIFLGGGLLLGVVALFGMTRHGRKGILTPALVGISIPVLLFVLALPNFLHARKLARSHGPPQTLVRSPSGQVLTNGLLRFSMEIPEGFVDWPEGAVSANVVHCYAKLLDGSNDLRLVINVQRLNGVIPPNQPLRREEVAQHAPPGTKLDLIQMSWRGYTVDTFVSELSQNGSEVIAYGIQVPLVPAAIQLNVGGPISQRQEIEKLADDLLASLDGNSNWPLKQ